MSILAVVKFPEEVLQTKSKEIYKVTDAERRLARDMIETMYAENGVGLAANQVGILKQIFVAIPEKKGAPELIFLNPKIIKKKGVIKEFEGCLSVPEFYEPVKRAKTVWMRAMTLDGDVVEVKGEGLHSRIYQHEIDHLNGMLFIDRLGILKSRLARKKLSKNLTK